MSATFIMEASKLMMTLSFLVVAVGSSANSPASALGELIDQKQYTGGESWRLSWKSSLHSLVQLVCRLRTAVGRVEWADLRLYSIPAIIYLVNDNILYFIYSMLDQAATFEVLSNLKIVATSFLYKFFLDKDISKTQWISLGLLGVGSVRALAVCKLGAPQVTFQNSADLSSLSGHIAAGPRGTRHWFWITCPSHCRHVHRTVLLGSCSKHRILGTLPYLTSSHP
jgi:hypothetical protein